MRDVQLFLKRLTVRSKPVRYFYVGEYGEQTQRPHYHLVLYGLDDVGYVWVKRAGYVLMSERVSAAWEFGHVHIMELNENTAAYITGYVSKKWTKRTPDGRPPEFARMSLKPGIGAGWAPKLAEFWNSNAGSLIHAEQGDVTKEVRVDGKKRPLGRYVVRKTREAAGYSPDTPDVVRLASQIDLSLQLQESPDLMMTLRRLGDDVDKKERSNLRLKTYRKKL